MILHPRSCSVIIPFHNEEANCREVLRELRPVLEALGPGAEVIAVDDGSTDATLSALREIAFEWPLVRVVPLAGNHGQAAALFMGMRSATAPVIVIMDGDGQNVAADIPKLLAALDGTDMVAGIRAKRNDSWLRRKMSRVANAIRGKMLGDGMRDSGCGLKVFRREVADSFLPMRTLYSFMPALAVAAGFRVAQVEVQHRARVRGQSHYGLGVMLWRPALDMLGLWWWRHRRFKIPAIQSEPK
ncbi:MAG: glycosyltransferase family 2 protein [Verrucomicrobiota bacterium]